MTHPYRVVGLDVSLTATGIASSTGWCRTVGRSNVTSAPLLVRLALVSELAESIIRHTGAPDLVVIESPAFSRSGGGSLERHALWWTVVRRLVGNDVAVAEVGPTTLKRYATGKGVAKKSAIVEMVPRRWPQYICGGDDNMADAVVLCAMGADHLGQPLAVMPKDHRAALDSVKWPDLKIITPRMETI